MDDDVGAPFDRPAEVRRRERVVDDELRAAGVSPGTIRLSVGTESKDDLIWDLAQGFAKVAATASTTGGAAR